MKYLKTYEEYRFKWNGIVEKDGNLYISLYKLANEMEESANNERETKKFVRGGYYIPDDKNIVKDKEEYYIRFVKKLLIDKLITFDSEDYGKNLTGICKDVIFDGGFEAKPENTFNIEHIHISLDSLEDEASIYEEVIVHSDEDAEQYKLRTKFNL